MQTKEPVYVYKKGEGWIIQTSPISTILNIGWGDKTSSYFNKILKSESDWCRKRLRDDFDLFSDFVSLITHKPEEWDLFQLKTIFPGPNFEQDIGFVQNKWRGSFCNGSCCLSEQIQLLVKFWENRL